MNTPAPAPCFRIVRGRDSRYCEWFDVETIDADGRRAIVATLDTRADARDLLRRLELHAARHAAAVRSLAECRAMAARLQDQRRTLAADGGPLAWVGFRDAAIFAGSIAADRARAADKIRQARAALKNF